MINIVNKQHPVTNHTVKVGQFYGRFDDGEKLYQVIRYMSPYGILEHTLIDIKTGHAYCKSSSNIIHIFGVFQDKFYLITEDITITID